MKRTAVILLSLLLPAVALGQPATEPAWGDDSTFFAAKAAAGGTVSGGMTAQAETLCKRRVHWVQLCLERYAVDQPQGYYPQHINQIVLGNYAKAGLYSNPFTASSNLDYDAVEVPFGWTENAPGNFSYLQAYDDAGAVKGYFLVLYGARADGGMDVTGDGQPDGVVMTLFSGIERMPFTARYLSGGREIEIVQTGE